MATEYGDANDLLNYGDNYESLFTLENITFSEFIKKYLFSFGCGHSVSRLHLLWVF